MFLGDYKQAEALVGEALSEGRQTADPTAHRLAAGVSLRQNRLETVDKYPVKFDQIADLSSDDKAWANRIRATLLLNTGRLADRDRALGLVDENLKANPDSVEDQLLNATLLAARPKRRGEAVKTLEKLASADRLDAGRRFLLAQLYLGERKDAQYQSEMQRLLDSKVRNPQHLAQFVNYWIVGNQLDQADRWLAELKKVEPKGLVTLELQARLLALRNRKPELLALLEARGHEVPDQIGSVADLLSHYGFATGAEQAYTAYIAREPKQPERVLPLARFLARQGRVAEAMEMLKKAWSTCPTQTVATAALPLYDAPSANEGQRRQVEDWLAVATHDYPDSLDLASKLALIRIRQGRFEEAETLFRQILGVDPDRTDVLNGLSWILAFRDSSRADEALRLIDRAIAIGNFNPLFLDTRAVVLFRAGRVDDALKAIENYRKAAPKYASFYVHMAWFYQAKGRLEEVRQAFQQAEALGYTTEGTDPLERPSMVKLRLDLGLMDNVTRSGS